MGNFMTGVKGLIGELVALSYAESIGFPYEHEILPKENKAVFSYDLKIFPTGWAYTVDAKCMFAERNENGRFMELFVVNKEANDKSASKGIDTYLPIITCTGSDIAFVGNTITPAEVSSWGTASFKYGAPAFVAKIADLATPCFGYTEKEIRDAMINAHGKLVSAEELIRLPRLLNLPEKLSGNNKIGSAKIVEEISELICLFDRL